MLVFSQIQKAKLMVLLLPRTEPVEIFEMLVGPEVWFVSLKCLILRKMSSDLCDWDAAHCIAWRVMATVSAASEAALKSPVIQNAFDFVFVSTQANINGRVLAQCNVDELKKEMNMNFGDWHLFRSMVRFYSIITGGILLYCANPELRNTGLNG